MHLIGSRTLFLKKNPIKFFFYFHVNFQILLFLFNLLLSSWNWKILIRWQGNGATLQSNPIADKRHLPLGKFVLVANDF